MYNIIISDHAPLPVLFTTVINNETKQWRFNNCLLKENDFVSMVREKTQEYIIINLKSVKSVQTVWEAFQVICRGWIINYQETQKNGKETSLELKHMLDPDNLQLKNCQNVNYKNRTKSIST